MQFLCINVSLICLVLRGVLCIFLMMVSGFGWFPYRCFFFIILFIKLEHLPYILKTNNHKNTMDLNIYFPVIYTRSHKIGRILNKHKNYLNKPPRKISQMLYNPRDKRLYWIHQKYTRQYSLFLRKSIHRKNWKVHN